ncbi:MAG: hypothetical protein AB7U73_04550 [Pirellulales bacterium]
MRKLLLTVVATLVGATTCPAADDLRVVKLTVSPAPRPDPAMKYRLYPPARELVPGNAAAMYYRAIVMTLNNLRHLNSDTADKSMLAAIDGEWLELPPDKLPTEARRGLSPWESALAEVALAARREQAVWDIPLREGGIATLLPEIQEIRSLVRLLALQAKLALAEGNYALAAQSLETMIRMGQHTSESGTLVSSLVGVACDSIAMSEIEFWIAEPDSPNLYWALTALPSPPIDIAAALESEHYWVGASLPYIDIMQTSVLSADQGRELARAAGEFLTMAIDNPTMELLPGMKVPVPANSVLLLPALATYPSAKRELIARGRPAAEVERMPVAQVVLLAWVQSYREHLDEAIAWGQRPYPEARAGIAKFDERFDASSRQPAALFSRLLLPAINAARLAGVRLEQRIALLRTLEALRLYAATHDGALPASLGDVTEVPIPLDPISGESFAYELSGATATLESREQTPYQHIRYEISVRK